MSEVIDLLARHVYGMSQVDWILRLRPGTARRWIDGYERSGKLYPPVVRFESTGEDLVSWGEFTETRLLSEFRSEGVSMHHMRPAVERLREVFDTPYPLAFARPWLDTRGRELIMEVQQEVGLDRKLMLVVVRNDQLALTLPTHRFVESVDFRGSDFVQRMNPVADLDHVWLDPLRQFGEPVVRSVPTSVIAEQVRAGDDAETIAELYELSAQEVWQAIRYELHRGREAPRAA